MPLPLHSFAPALESACVLRGTAEYAFPCVVRFFSPSCSICVAQEPEFLSWVEAIQGQAIHVVHILSPRDPTERDGSQIGTIGNHLGYGNIVADLDGSVAKSFRNQFLPAYYLFSYDGTLAHYQAGASALQRLKSAATRLMRVG